MRPVRAANGIFDWLDTVFGGGNIWDRSSGVPKSPLWNISELQADELAYEKSMYGAENVVTGPNGWPAQNTSCRSVPRVGYRLAVPVYCKTVAAIVRARAWVQSGKVVPGREQWRLDRKAARDA